MKNTAYNVSYKQIHIHHIRYPYPTPYAIAYAVPMIGKQAPGEGYVLFMGIIVKNVLLVLIVQW